MLGLDGDAIVKFGVVTSWRSSAENKVNVEVSSLRLTEKKSKKEKGNFSIIFFKISRNKKFYEN